MEIKKPKSNSPKVHDNTEEDLILVPPSVLDNKLRDFEEYQRLRGGIGGGIALVVTLAVAVFTANFINIPYINGSAIRGAFVMALLFALAKLIYDGYKLFKTNKRNRASLINSLQGSGSLEDKKEE